MRRAVATFALVAGLGCVSTHSSGSRSRVMPEYRNARLGGGELVIVPISQIDFQVPSTSGFDEAYYRYFAEELPSELRKVSRFDSVRFAEPEVIVSLELRELPLGEQPLRIPLPADGTIVRYDALPARYLLFVSEARVHPGETPGVGTVHTAAFTFWDNSAGRIVAYGRAEITGAWDPDAPSATPRIAVEQARTFVRALAAQMVQGSPFFGQPR